MSPDSTSRRPIWFGWVILAILILVILSDKIVSGPFPNHRLISPELLKALHLNSTFQFVYQDEKVGAIIQHDLQGKDGHYAVYVEDLSTGDHYGVNASEILPSASLYKVFLLAAVAKQIEQGKLQLDTPLKADKSHLVDLFGDVDFGYEDVPDNIEYTVAEAVERVGRVSDNFAALMLAEQVGWGSVQSMANQLGAEHTTIKSPISTTAVDIAEAFKSLYLVTTADPRLSNPPLGNQSAQFVLDMLALNQINDRIPAKLPEEVKISQKQGTEQSSQEEMKPLKIIHKTGELPHIRHDAGIVFLDTHPYVVVLMGTDLPYEDDGVETLAQISKDIFDYYNSKKLDN
jgi:beta-lactamase class A